MRRIFVPLHGPDDAATLLHLAGQLASCFGAQVEAAFVNDVAVPGEEPVVEDAAGAAAVRAVFEAWSSDLAAAGPAAADLATADLATAGGRPRVGTTWREMPDGVVYAGASLGRASDLIVTGAARRAADGERALQSGRGERSFRNALLASGRLTLLAPASAVGAPLLERVVIAWDGSAGAAHALAQSLPLLIGATSVRVVIIGRNTVGVGAREAIASYVALYHEDARLLVRDNAHRQTGRALLDALGEERASMVVMGVCGRSHPAGTAGAAGAAGALGGTILKVIEDGRFPVLTAS